MAFKKMITAVDTHAGEPMRVITGGVPHIPGSSVFEKMKWLAAEGDDLRMMMLREPRGYPPVCCNLIVPPCHPDADAGFIVMEQTEYPAMSGGNTISVVTVLLETGILPKLNTGIAHKTPGIGMVGAGVLRAPAQCFADAFEAVKAW